MATHLRPEPPEAVHWDVAAYALGVLDPAEIGQCELHLADCPSCAAELAALLPVSALLADVDPHALRELDDPALLDRLTCAVRADRRRSGRRRRLTSAVALAAAVVLAGFSLFAGVNWLGPEPGAPLAGQTQSPPPAGEREQFSAADPDSGVTADVVLTGRDWGTHVAFELSALTGPLECQLLLVYHDGTSEPVGSWRVPVEGYGTAQQPRPLELEAAVSADREQLTELRVTTVDPDGATGTLITVPL